MKKEKLLRSDREIERHQLLFSLGFEEIQTDVYRHKMLPFSKFDFSAQDADVYWTMDLIFKTCIKEGERHKSEKIRAELGI